MKAACDRKYFLVFGILAVALALPWIAWELNPVAISNSWVDTLVYVPLLLGSPTLFLGSLAAIVLGIVPRFGLVMRPVDAALLTFVVGNLGGWPLWSYAISDGDYGVVIPTACSAAFVSFLVFLLYRPAV
ncbi:hypothetical protein [Vogesella oryzae]|uniref:hypothetical protein n=1 Tax=Vogesella oryzae TaxID=1735285 RepID=UPI00158193C5|nr:hypothetical protein [Vogesella oryzae]